MNRHCQAHNPDVAFFRKIGIGLILLTAQASSVSFAGPFETKALAEIAAAPRTEVSRSLEQQVKIIFKKLDSSVAEREIFVSDINEQPAGQQLQVSWR